MGSTYILGGGGPSKQVNELFVVQLQHVALNLQGKLAPETTQHYVIQTYTNIQT